MSRPGLLAKFTKRQSLCPSIWQASILRQSVGLRAEGMSITADIILDQGPDHLSIVCIPHAHHFRPFGLGITFDSVIKENLKKLGELHSLASL